MEEKVAKSKGKKGLVVVAVICIILIGGFIILSGMNNSAREEVHAALVGNVFSGKFTYYGDAGGVAGDYTIKNTYTIEIIDESKCNITIHYTTDGINRETDVYLFQDRDETITYTDVTYTLSGGSSGVTITWSFDDASITGFYQKPFTVDASGETITMLCSEFLYDTSLTLTEK